MNDIEKALQNADNNLNKGIMGWFTKLFFGKANHTKFNDALDQAKKYSGPNALTQTGIPAKATVLKIEDTGAMINYDPVVRMQLKVQPDYGAGFETAAETVVSKIAVPRVGDIINIKYDATNNSNIVIV